MAHICCHRWQFTCKPLLDSEASPQIKNSKGRAENQLGPSWSQVPSSAFSRSFSASVFLCLLHSHSGLSFKPPLTMWPEWRCWKWWSDWIKGYYGQDLGTKAKARGHTGHLMLIQHCCNGMLCSSTHLLCWLLFRPRLTDQYQFTGKCKANVLVLMNFSSTHSLDLNY